MKETKFVDNCAVMEQTGDVTKVQDHYKETGELTLESDLRNE